MNKTDLDNLSLMEYGVRVRTAAYEKNGEPIYNGSADHAEIILTNLWESAESNVKVLSQSLNESVYDSDALIEAAQSFLAKPGATAEVLFEDAPAPTNRFYKALRAHDNVEIKQVPRDQQNRYDFCMTVVDGISHRFAEDKYEMTAVAAFGDELNAKHLGEVFNHIKTFKSEESPQ